MGCATPSIRARQSVAELGWGRRFGLAAVGPLGLALVLAVVVGACEPTSAPVRSPSATRSPATATATPAASGAASPGSSPAATSVAATAGAHPTGSPAISVDGSSVTALGRGEKNTQVFTLGGNYIFRSSECPGTKVIPFVWVYEEFGASRGTYVDPEFHVKNLKGRFYLRISAPPACDWTVTLTAE